MRPMPGLLGFLLQSQPEQKLRIRLPMLILHLTLCIRSKQESHLRHVHDLSLIGASIRLNTEHQDSPNSCLD